ncbi:MAG TPA: DHH family phosphoesterase [Caproicibacter sp.]|nr:DHH family phosphoesterase [Caproicibacter sp.]
MKRKVWASSPVFFTISAVMLAMAGVSWFWNSTVFYVEISVAAVSIAAVLMATAHFHAHVSDAVKSAQTVLSGEQYRLMQKFALPIVVVGEAGDMVWINESFWNTVCEKRECRGENIQKFIYPKTVQEILKADGTDISVGKRRYTVYGTETASGSMMYFVDNTYYKDIEQEYNETRPSIALAYFDNREELARYFNNSEDSRIASEVEATLIKWAQSMGGFLKKMSSGRFIIFTDERHVRQEMEKRFPVLDSIRSIHAAERLTATVSIGISRGAKSPKEAEIWARNALDMALGRGGDQVAVKQENDTYEFFGGLSKGVERRDKVRTRVFAATISDNIKESDSVFIMGHKYSDLDCIGSATGIWNAAAKSLNHPAYIVVDRSQSLAGPLISNLQSAHPGEKIFITPQEALMKVTPKTTLIVVDTHSPDFVESPDLLKAVSRVIVIDHHRMMVRHIENAIVFYHEPFASSASEMVTELVQYIGDKMLEEPEAEALLAGIMLDTKNFVLKTGVRTFEAAAYLRRKDADTVKVKRLFSDSINAYKAKYKIVSNAQIYGSYAVASTETEFPDIRISAAQAADELLSIQGVDASFVIFPAGGVINISARSLGEVNVQLVMEELGGGGHLTMAGAQISDVTVQEATDKLISAIQKATEKVHQS